MNTILIIIGITFLLAVTVYGCWDEIRFTYKMRRARKMINREHERMKHKL